MPGPIGRTADWEVYSGLRARAPAIVRADGRGFKALLKDHRKPYDEGFARSMAQASSLLFTQSGLSPALAYTFSDEVNVLFTDLPFSGRVEKLVSVIPSFLSGALSLSMGQVVSMDGRAIPICPVEVASYLSSRQDEAWRNHVFSYGFYALVSEGMSRRKAMEEVKGLTEPQIHELLFKRGLNLAKSPAWERRGIMIYRKGGELVEGWDLPLFDSGEGLRLIEEITGYRGQILYRV